MQGLVVLGPLLLSINWLLSMQILGGQTSVSSQQFCTWEGLLVLIVCYNWQIIGKIIAVEKWWFRNQASTTTFTSVWQSMLENSMRFVLEEPKPSRTLGFTRYNVKGWEGPQLCLILWGEVSIWLVKTILGVSMAAQIRGHDTIPDAASDGFLLSAINDKQQMKKPWFYSYRL